MSARIAGYILILQSEKNHDSVERLNLADRITEVEKANNLLSSTYKCNFLGADNKQ